MNLQNIHKYKRKYNQDHGSYQKYFIKGEWSSWVKRCSKDTQEIRKSPLRDSTEASCHLGGVLLGREPGGLSWAERSRLVGDPANRQFHHAWKRTRKHCLCNVPKNILNALVYPPKSSKPVHTICCTQAERSRKRQSLPTLRSYIPERKVVRGLLFCFRPLFSRDCRSSKHYNLTLHPFPNTF